MYPWQDSGKEGESKGVSPDMSVKTLKGKEAIEPFTFIFFRKLNLFVVSPYHENIF